MRKTDDAEFLRFLELQDLLQQRGTQRLTLPESKEYQRLLVKYGVYTIDALMVGPPDPTRIPRAIAILNTDCQAIPGDKPLICPRSRPRLPPEYLSAMEQRCRELGRVGAGKTILWVKRGAEMETFCLWDHGRSCFDPAERVERWRHAAEALLSTVSQVLQGTPAAEGLSPVLRQTRNMIRVLGPLGCWSEAGLSPEFPPQEFVVALDGLSAALAFLEKPLAVEGSTAMNAERIGPSLERLASAAKAFRAAVARVWPDGSATGRPVLPQSEKGETPESSIAQVGSAVRRLLFEPGAFVYGDRRHPLSGKPLQVLQALATARGQSLTLVELRERCWADAEIGEETIRSAVKTARRALRHAMQVADVKTRPRFDPIPSVDRGTGRTASRLKLP